MRGFRYPYPAVLARLKLLMLGLLCTTSLHAAATAGVDAGAGYLTEQDLLGDIPTITSVTGLDQRISDSPASITIIDRDLIRTSGVVHLADIFRLVPGMQVYHVNGNRFAVTAHGMSNEFPSRLEVRVDGRSVYLPLLSTIEWSSLGLELDDIERIEVVRGSNVPAQGSNAFLGSINIITRHPLQDAGTLAKVTVGDQQAHRYSLRHNGHLADIDYRLTAGYTDSDGFRRLRDGQAGGFIDLRADYDPSLRDEIELQLGYSQSTIGVGDGDNPAGFHDVRFHSNHQYLQWQHRLAGDNRIQVKFFHNAFMMNDRQFLGQLSALIAPIPPALIGQPDQPIFIGDRDNLTERYDLEFNHSLRPLAKTRLFWGIGARYDRLDSNWLLDGAAPVHNASYRLFGNLEWRPFHWLVFNAGTMIEDNEIVGTQVSPRAAVNIHLSPQHTLRLSATEAHRTPSLLEANDRQIVRFLDGSIGDVQNLAAPDLQEEDLTSYELGYIGRWPRLGLQADFKYYLEVVRRGIDDAKLSGYPGDLISGFFLKDNILHWNINGLDSQITWRPGHHDRLTLQYSYADADGIRVRNPNDISSMKNRIPRHTFSILGSHRFAGGIETSLAYYRVSPVKWLGGKSLGWYGRTDFRIGIPLQAAHIEGEASFTVQNLFNQDYIEYQANNVFERRVYFQVRLGIL